MSDAGREPNPIPVLYADVVGILGGAERSLLDILDTLDRTKVAPTVLLLSAGPLEEELARRNIPVIRVAQGALSLLSRKGGAGIFGWIRGVLQALLCSWQIAQEVKRGGFQILHSNTHKTHYLSTLTRYLTDARVVWHLREILGRAHEGSSFRFLARRVPHHILANSLATRESLDPTRSKPYPVSVLQNGIDCARYATGDRNAQRKAWGLAEEDIVIALIGMLCPLKGQHRLLGAASRLCQTPEQAAQYWEWEGGEGPPPEDPLLTRLNAVRDRLKFVFVGAEAYETSDPGLAGYRKRLTVQTETLHLEEHVVFAGMSSNMADVYAAADIVVSLSDPPESFGRCIVEAMAASRPVVSVDQGGPTRIVLDKETGHLVALQDTEALVHALADLATDKDRCFRLGQAGRERAFAKYDRTPLGPACTALYQRLLGQDSGEA